MDYKNLKDFIENGNNTELPNWSDVQIAVENEKLVLYTLTPEDTLYDTEKAEQYLREVTNYEPFTNPDSGGYEVGVEIPYSRLQPDWYNLTIEQFGEIDEIYRVSSIVDDIGDRYVIE